MAVRAGALLLLLGACVHSSNSAESPATIAGKFAARILTKEGGCDLSCHSQLGRARTRGSRWLLEGEVMQDVEDTGDLSPVVDLKDGVTDNKTLSTPSESTSAGSLRVSEPERLFEEHDGCCRTAVRKYSKVRIDCALRVCVRVRVRVRVGSRDPMFLLPGAYRRPE